MFFFFNDLKIQNPSNFDLDLFIKDEKKLIHISTAGMTLENTMLEGIDSLRSNFKTILSYRRQFNIETNPEITRDNIMNIESYTSFFNFISKKGFYSYDKFDINNPDDKRFQLISLPIYDRNISVNDIDFLTVNNQNKKLNYNLNFINSRNVFPENNEPFELFDYL